MAIEVCEFNLTLKYDSGRKVTFEVKCPKSINSLADLPSEAKALIERNVVGFAKEANPETGKMASEIAQQKAVIEQQQAAIDKLNRAQKKPDRS